MLLLDVEAARRGRGSRGKRRRRSDVQNPPEFACRQGCDGQCKWDTTAPGCRGTAGKDNPECWYCAINGNEPYPYEDACTECTSPWANGCVYDDDTCTKLEANFNIDCWLCTGPPADACASNCIVGVDQCIFDGACGDDDDALCYFCRDPETNQPKAPSDACSECGGPSSEECQAIEGDDECTRSERYHLESCWECVVPGSGQGVGSTVGGSTTTTTPRPPRGNRGRGRGSRGRGRRRK
jgi:hypothetical protein